MTSKPRTRLNEAIELKSKIPLRKKCYKHLRAYLRQHSQQSLPAIVRDLKQAMKSDPEAGLLLYELYEVLESVAVARQALNTEYRNLLAAAMYELFKAPYACTEVMF